MNSILVIRLTSLGDVILATTLVRQLARTYPRAVIDVAVNPKFADVWKNNPHVRKVWPFAISNSSKDVDEVKFEILGNVPGGQFDLVVDLQNNLRSRVLRKGLGSAVVRLDKHRLEKLALVYLKKKPVKTTSIVARYRKTVEHLPLAFDVEGPELWLAEEASRGYYVSGELTSERSNQRSEVHSGEAPCRIAIAPGARHYTKRWPVAKWIELCKNLSASGYELTIVGAAADVELNSEIVLGSRVEIERGDGATTLEQTVQALDKCEAVICVDSAIMHMAAARRKPIVAIFGSSVTELGFSPVGTKHVIVQHDVACRPCSHIGRKSCPKGHFLCMEGITPREVQSALELLVT